MIIQKNAFTLIELIVWISIIAIISIWISRLYWSNIPDKQRLELFTSKLVSVIDTVKNYALVWKWVWENLETPKYYKVVLTKSWVSLSGSTLVTYYNTGLTDVYFNDMSINPFDKYYNIHWIKCITLAWVWWTNPNNITIWYEWSNITLSWCSNNYEKIVEIELYYKWFKNKIRLNSISWVLEEVKY